MDLHRSNSPNLVRDDKLAIGNSGKNDVTNPVWNVYDEYRTAKLNVKYYSYKLANATKWDFHVSLILAISSSSSISGLWLLEKWQNGILWKGLGAIAAFLAVYRTVAKSSESIRKLEQRVTAYRAIEFDLERLTRDISENKSYDEEMKRKFNSIMDRKQAFVLSYVDSEKNDDLNIKCACEVNRELPVENFFIPKEAEHDR
jgi:hypothetical protein